MYCYYPKRRRRRGFFKKTLSWLLVLAVLVGIWFYYRNRIVKTVVEYTTYEINSLTTASVNQAVLLSLNGNVSYDDLISVQKDGAGNITLVSSDAYKINTINREIAVSAQSLIKTACAKGVKIPFGALTGITLISGFGSEVNLDILTTESVICNFSSAFEAMGINQTRHSIYLEVVSDVKIIMPAASQNVRVTTDVLICEAVIVGKIPEVYLNGNLFN